MYQTGCKNNCELYKGDIYAAKGLHKMSWKEKKPGRS